MLFLDPRSESNNRIGPDDISSSADSLSGLLEKWGVEIPDGKLTGDRSMAWRVNAGTQQRVIPADYVVWLAVSGEQMNQDDPVTSRLPLVNIASAGYIDRKKKFAAHARTPDHFDRETPRLSTWTSSEA